MFSYLRVHSGVLPPLALAKALVCRVIAQTEEPLGVVEVEVVSGDARFYPEETFYPLQLGDRVFDQVVSVHD